MGDDGLRVERMGDAVWCVLDRPPLNLLEPALIARLHAVFRTLAADASVRVAVLTGAGHAFTAGMDVRVLRDLDPAAAATMVIGALMASERFSDDPAAHFDRVVAELERALTNPTAIYRSSP